MVLAGLDIDVQCGRLPDLSGLKSYALSDLYGMWQKTRVTTGCLSVLSSTLAPAGPQSTAFGAVLKDVPSYVEADDYRPLY